MPSKRAPGWRFFPSDTVEDKLSGKSSGRFPDEARFLTEARAVNMVQHPGLVSIFEFGRTDQGAAYLVMEYLEGPTLRARMDAQRPLPVSDTRRIMRQIANALAAAHDKSVVHRDLKPENVMLVPEPELPGGERAKILDFGIAKVAQPAAGAMTQAGALLGTPAYMSPEQCMGAGNADEKSDVYALGVMLFEMLAGALPFEAEGPASMMVKHLQSQPRPLRELSREVPVELEALVARMLAKTPADRPTAREVARALEASPSLVDAPLARSAAPAYVHRSYPATIAENWTYLDHPQANNNPDAVILFSQNWNPGGQGGVYNNHHIGVWFVSNGRWAIYNEDRAPMPPQAAFNVLVTRSGFVHQASPRNIINNWTILDHPSCNNRKDALLLVSPNWNPRGLGGTYNNHAIGVWYTNGRWAIFNQDRAPMPPGAAFNVLVADQTFCHRVTASSLVGVNGTWLAPPSARGNPDGVVLVTANWNPGGLGDIYHDHPLGVYYCGDRWAIFNQDMAPMPLGAAFNVWIA
jgi:serine/threonine protein kinase